MSRKTGASGKKHEWDSIENQRGTALDEVDVEQDTEMQLQKMDVNVSVSPDDDTQLYLEGQAIDSEDFDQTTDFVALYKRKGMQEAEEQAMRSKREGVMSIVLSAILVISYSILSAGLSYNTEAEFYEKYLSGHWKLGLFLILLNGVIATVQLRLVFRNQVWWPLSWMGFALAMFLFLLSGFGDQQIGDMQYMGVVNWLHFVLFLAFACVFLLFDIFSRCRQAAGPVFIVVSTIFVIAAIYFFKSRVISSSCNYWDSDNISHSISGLCNVQKPAFCVDSSFSLFQDISSLVPSCELNKILPMTSPFSNSSSLKSQYAAYPNAQQLLRQSAAAEAATKTLQERVISQISRYDNEQTAFENGHEVVLDETTMKYKIAVHRNESIAMKAAENEKKAQTTSMARNIIIISLTGFSRPALHVKLPSTINWLNEQKGGGVEAAAAAAGYEFFRFNANEKTDKLISTSAGEVISSLESAGFVSGRVSDECIELSEEKSFDHQSFGFSCDPNFADEKYTLSRGAHSSLPRCLYKQDISHYMFEYASSFLAAYKSERKVLRIEFNLHHDITGEVIRQIDQPLKEFIERIMETSANQETVVAIVSEHGMHRRGIFEKLAKKANLTENNLPALFLALSPLANQRLGQQISAKQQMLISADNLRHFFMHLAHGDSYQQKHLCFLKLSQNEQLQCVQLSIPKDICSCV